MKDSLADLKINIGEQDKFLHHLKNSTITEFAEYLGGDLDMAVQLRIDEAVEQTYEKIAARQGVIAQDMYKKWAAELGQGQSEMEVTARPITPQGNLYGFASVKIGGVRIDDFKIVADKDGKLFVGMPSKPDKTSKTGYRNTVFVDKDFKDDFNKAVLSAHYEAVEKVMERADKIRPAPDKPPRMADQMEKAQKQADRHNAALPAQEKSGKNRGGRE